MTGLQKWRQFCRVRSQRFELGCLDSHFSFVGMHIFSYTQTEKHLWKPGCGTPHTLLLHILSHSAWHLPPIALCGCISTNNQMVPYVSPSKGVHIQPVCQEWSLSWAHPQAVFGDYQAQSWLVQAQTTSGPCCAMDIPTWPTTFQCSFRASSATHRLDFQIE